MKYKEFVDNYNNIILPNKPDFIRRGQALMNYLAESNIDLYNDITEKEWDDTTKIDCFYNDIHVINTLNYLEKVWKLK